jgi:hypothetical protein
VLIQLKEQGDSGRKEVRTSNQHTTSCLNIEGCIDPTASGLEMGQDAILGIFSSMLQNYSLLHSFPNCKLCMLKHELQ